MHQKKGKILNYGESDEFFPFKVHSPEKQAYLSDFTWRTFTATTYSTKVRTHTQTDRKKERQTERHTDMSKKSLPDNPKRTLTSGKPLCGNK